MPNEQFGTITEAETIELLRHDLAIAEAAVRRLITVPLTQSQFDALVSFMFNVGEGALEKSTFRNSTAVTDLRVSPHQLLVLAMNPSASSDDPRWCPFCNPEPQRVFLRLRHVYALWDGFPVTEGHALIVPYRHVPTWFDAADTERAELFSALDAVCSIIRERGGIDGFNFGVNVGAAAGQTVPHLHQHVIPRRTGDMPDPRGGVRHVIPGKGNYLIARDAPRAPSIADAGPGQPWRIESPPLLTTGNTHPLLPHLEQDLSTATRVDIAVAFVMPSGIERLYAHFDDLLRRGGSLRLLTGDYLGVTDPVSASGSSRKTKTPTPNAMTYLNSVLLREQLNKSTPI